MTASPQARTSRSWHTTLARYFRALPHFVNGTNGWAPDDRPMTRRAEELPYHLVEAELWEEVERELCDVYFVETAARTGSKALSDLLNEYVRACFALHAQAELLARRERYRGEDGLVHWTDEAREEELERIREHPTRNDKLRAFRNFLREEKYRLDKYGHIAGFAVQTAYNSAREGPVAQNAERVAQRSSAPMVLLKEHSRPEFLVDTPLLHVMAEHTNEIEKGFVCADEAMAVTWSRDCTARAWNLESGRRLSTLSTWRAELGPLDNKITAVQRLNQASLFLVRTPFQLFLWEPQSGRSKAAKNLNGKVFDALVCSHSNCVLVRGQSGVGTWKYNDEKHVGWFDGALSDHSGWTKYANEQHLVTWGENGAQVWEIPSGRCIHTLVGPVHPYVGGAIVSERHDLVWTRGLVVHAWRNGECVATIPHENGEIHGFQLLEDQRRLLVWGHKQFAIWDLVAGRRTAAGTSGRHIKWARTYRDDSLLLVADGSGEADVWDTSTGEPVLEDIGACCNQQGKWPDPEGGALVQGRYLVTTTNRVAQGGKMVVRVWDLVERSVIFTLERSRGGFLMPDGRILVALCRHDVELWDISTGVRTAVLHHQADVKSVTFFAGGRRMVTTTSRGDCSLRVWDFESGRCVQILRGHSDQVFLPNLYANDTRLFTWSNDGTARVWDLEAEGRSQSGMVHDGTFPSVVAAWQEKAQIMTEAGNGVLWSTRTGAPLGTLAEVGMRVLVDERNARLIDLNDHANGESDPIFVRHSETLDLLGTLDGQSGFGRKGQLFAGGSRLLTSSFDKTLRIWDLERYECLRVLKGHRGVVKGAMVFAAESRVLSWSDKELLLWGTDEDAPLHSLSGFDEGRLHAPILIGDEQAISGGQGRSIKLWSLRTGVCLQTFDDSGDFLLLSERQLLITSGSEVRVWDLQTGTVLRTLCEAVKKEQWHGKLIRGGSGLLVWNSNVLVKFDTKTWSRQEYTASFIPSGYWPVLFNGDKRAIAVTETHFEVIDLESLSCEHRLVGHEMQTTHRLEQPFHVDEKGSRLLSNWMDRTVRVWDLDSGGCLQVLDGVDVLWVHNEEGLALAPRSQGGAVWFAHLRVAARNHSQRGEGFGS